MNQSKLGVCLAGEIYEQRCSQPEDFSLTFIQIFPNCEGNIPTRSTCVSLGSKQFFLVMPASCLLNTVLLWTVD